MLTTDQIELLRSLADRYETADFLCGDPSQFMHLVSGDCNRETMAFVAASLSYGSRQQFLPKIQKLLDSSEGQMYQWMASGGYAEAVPDDGSCFYRLYTNHDYRHFLDTLALLLHEYGSLADFARTHATGDDAMSVLNALTAFFANAGATKVIPKDTTSACKRLCMFMRWLVRCNSPVDLGQWTFLHPRTLVIPLDTHVLSQAQNLGLISTRNASMRTARQLTTLLAEAFPDDPTRADFALFGLGVNSR